MDTKVPQLGTGRFQWNSGGWFGTSVGSCAWMLVACGFLFIHNHALLALVPFVGFAVIQVVATVLWLRRDRIAPFPALMTLLAVFAILMPVVWLCIQSMASPAALAAMNWPVSIWPTVLVLTIVPIVMIKFVVMEYTSRPTSVSKR